jgi:hypothetical protein
MNHPWRFWVEFGQQQFPGGETRYSRGLKPNGIHLRKKAIHLSKRVYPPVYGAKIL